MKLIRKLFQPETNKQKKQRQKTPQKTTAIGKNNNNNSKSSEAYLGPSQISKDKAF